MTQPTYIDFASKARHDTATSQPIAIASSNTSSRKSSFSDTSSGASLSTSNPFSSSSLQRRHSIERPSAYVSDEDLFGEDLDEPYLSEPPQAPRSAACWLAQPLLPPVTSPMTPVKTIKSKRKGSKTVRFSKSSLPG